MITIGNEFGNYHSQPICLSLDFQPRAHSTHQFTQQRAAHFQFEITQLMRKDSHRSTKF